MQVAALFDGLLIAGRLFCLGGLSNEGGGLEDEGRLGRRGRLTDGEKRAVLRTNLKSGKMKLSQKALSKKDGLNQ